MLYPVTPKLRHRVRAAIERQAVWEDGFIVGIQDERALAEALWQAWPIAADWTPLEEKAAAHTAAWIASLAPIGFSLAKLSEAADLSLRNTVSGGDAGIARWRRLAALEWMKARGCPESTAHALLNRYPADMARARWVRWKRRRQEIARQKADGTYTANRQQAIRLRRRNAKVMPRQALSADNHGR